MGMFRNFIGTGCRNATIRKSSRLMSLPIKIGVGGRRSRAEKQDLGVKQSSPLALACSYRSGTARRGVSSRRARRQGRVPYLTAAYFATEVDIALQHKENIGLTCVEHEPSFMSRLLSVAGWGALSWVGWGGSPRPFGPRWPLLVRRRRYWSVRLLTTKSPNFCTAYRTNFLLFCLFAVRYCPNE